MQEEKVVELPARSAPQNVMVTNEYFEKIANNIKVLRDLINKPFPPKPGYWIARAIAKVESLSKPFLAAKQNIVQQHAELDENDKPKADKKTDLVIWDKEKGGAEAYNEDMKKLLGEEVELAGINYIELDLDEFDKRMERMNSTITLLEWMLMPFVTSKGDESLNP